MQSLPPGSAALFLAGSVLCLPGPWMVVSLGVAAVVADCRRTAQPPRARTSWSRVPALRCVFLGLLAYIVHALAGTLPGAPSWSIGFIAASTILCYAFINPNPGQSWKAQVLQLVFASVAATAATALLVKALASLITLWMLPGAHHLAFIRTLTLCLAALALAFGGAFWRRVELTRIGYAALALVAVKLVAEDLPLGHLAYIAASIFLFALIDRRSARRAYAPSHINIAPSKAQLTHSVSHSLETLMLLSLVAIQFHLRDDRPASFSFPSHFRRTLSFVVPLV